MVTKIHNLTFALMAALGCCLSTQAQQQIAVNSASAPTGYGLEVEVVSENIGPLIGALGVTDLTGYSCTRLYITTTNADDFMSSISGDATNPTYVNTTTNFYHAVLGAATPNGINSLLFPVYPDLAYDSWVTIGLEGAPNAAAGEAAVATVQSLDNPWTTNFDTGGGLPGANISIDDPIGGAWYALNGDANGVAGADLKVLVGQFTTTGDLSGQLYAQVFINGDGSNEFRDTFYFPEAPGGCTDPEACNYDPAAPEDDGSCEYPATAFVDCDGFCLNDTNDNGLCDEEEDAGCTDTGACNFDLIATLDDGSCEYDSCAGCTDDGACNYDADATIDDSSCEYDSCAGCTDAGACNYDADATIDDSSCEYSSCAGCTDSGACNYDPTATIEDGSCDFVSCAGCTDSGACNYDATATIDDGSCEFPEQFYNCDESCINDTDGDGICDELETVGCTDPTACNYSASATEDDGTCFFAADYYDCQGNCLSDTDGDGVCDELEIAGCDDDTACNYDAAATDNDGSCTYAEQYYDCDGNCINDADGDGVCDELEIPGCQDNTACNYNDAATDDDGSCTYAEQYYDCDGNCINDTDGDGVCDELEVPGCTDSGACNYDAAATDDDASCEYLSCAGCTDPAGCNYDDEATIEDGSCTYTDGICETCEDGVIVDNDADDDGVCNDDEIVGCQDAEACNYDATATDPGTCEYPIDLYGVDNVDCDGNCLNDADGDLVCDEDEIVGCQEPDACNYDATATDPGQCDYPIDLYGADNVDCDGACLNDTDGDLVCDEDEIFGCTDTIACNFLPAATEEDSTCTYPAEFYLDCDGNCLNDEDGDGLCDEVEALIPPEYNPDWNGDYCYTVADLTHLLCLFGTCGPDTTGGPDYNPFFGEDSCYSAFDLIPFLTLFQTCLEVSETAESPIGGDDGSNGGGMNDDATNEDDE